MKFLWWLSVVAGGVLVFYTEWQWEVVVALFCGCVGGASGALLHEERR